MNTEKREQSNGYLTSRLTDDNDNEGKRIGGEEEEEEEVRKRKVKRNGWSVPDNAFCSGKSSSRPTPNTVLFVR